LGIIFILFNLAARLECIGIHTYGSICIEQVGGITGMYIQYCTDCFLQIQFKGSQQILLDFPSVLLSPRI